MATQRHPYRTVLAGALLVHLLVLLEPVVRPQPASAAPADPDWATAADIDAFVAEQASALDLPGLAAVVLANGDVLFEGATSVSPAGEPEVSLDTPVALGSTSKQLTGLAVQQLIAQDRLALDDQVVTLLPELKPVDNAWSGLTIRHLLTHRGGFSERDGNSQWRPWPPSRTLADEAERLAGEPLDAEPGERFEYSNANYTLLGAIVERVTAQPYDKALRELVVGPFGLEHTTSDLDVARSDGLAAGHYEWFGLVDAVTPAPYTPVAAPSSFVTSTARDLTTVVGAHLGRPTGIEPAVLEAARTPLAAVDEFSEYSSGWYSRALWQLTDENAGWDDPDLPIVWEHHGTTLRSMSYLAVAPELGLGVVVLSNTGLGTDQERWEVFTDALLHEVLGTRAGARAADPLISAAPSLLLGLPLLLLVVDVWLTATARRAAGIRRHWVPVLIGGMLTAGVLYLTFGIVPERVRAPLFDPLWWAGVPDLAASVAAMLLLAAWYLALLVHLVLRAVGERRDPRRRPDRADEVRPATAG